MADWVDVGSEAPDFTLPSDQGETIQLKKLRGQIVVLYFYPKDDTPGCTREACSFRDAQAEMKKLGAVVLGISADDIASHQKFRSKHRLNFPLLADVDHRVAEAYGAWREKTRFGKKTMGIQRSTFLIDKDGIVRKVWKNVQVDGHDQQVLQAIRELLAD